jgi:hypothetical protein
MKITSTLAAAACVAVLSPFAAQAAAPQPTAGFYRAVVYITDATPTAVCAAFNQTAGTTSTGVFGYPGPSSTGAALSFADAVNGKVLTNYFPKTPAAHATTWTGKLSAGNEPSGPYVTVPFTVTITYLDQQSFTAVEKATITVGANKCTVTENMVFILSGT